MVVVECQPAVLFFSEISSCVWVIGIGIVWIYSIAWVTAPRVLVRAERKVKASAISGTNEKREQTNTKRVNVAPAAFCPWFFS